MSATVGSLAADASTLTGTVAAWKIHLRCCASKPAQPASRPNSVTRSVGTRQPRRVKEATKVLKISDITAPAGGR